MNISRLVSITAAALGTLAVLIGAFGAHVLKVTLENNSRFETFETASQYHFFHSIVLLILGFLLGKTGSKLLKLSAYSFILGILFFSGSLYSLSITNNTELGAIAPIGGILLTTGWILLLLHFLKHTSH